MDNKLFIPSKLVFPALFALTGLFACSPDAELEPTTNLDPTMVNEATGATPTHVKYKGKHYILQSSTETLPAGIEKQIASANGKVTNLMTAVGIATVYSEDPAFIAKASKIKGVRSVVRDLEIEWFNPEDQKIVALEETNITAYGNPPASGDNDSYFDLQWGHAAIKASDAWNKGARGKGVRVAVLDSGFDLDHADLAPNIDLTASMNFVPTEELSYALTGVGSHGTHTAGTIAAADNGIGIIGVAPEAELILVKVLRDSGTGAFSWIMQGILHATAQGADVINMSIGATLPRNGKFLDDNGTPDDPTDDFIVSDTKAVQELLNALSRITSYATKQGVTVFASAGNEANNGNTDKSSIHLPSGSVGVTSISATAPRGWALGKGVTMDNLASYSNYGIPDVQFAAPGGDYVYPGSEIAVVGGIRQYVYVFDYVFSAGSNLDPTKASYYWSVGTSMASPHAAGVAALIIGQNGGSMDPANVLAKMRASADDIGKPGRDPLFGYGRLNALRAVSK